MGLRRHLNRQLPPDPGAGLVEVLHAVARGEVTRDDCDGKRVGMWALYRHGAHEVGMSVRQLARFELVDVPLLGPPKLNANGEAWLAAHARPSCVQITEAPSDLQARFRIDRLSAIDADYLVRDN